MKFPALAFLSALAIISCDASCPSSERGNGAGGCETCRKGRTGIGCAVATLCAANEFVSSNVCTPCVVNDGKNDAGDDASGLDTVCDELCAVNYHVTGNDCINCAKGKVNVAGDDPSSDDTICDIQICEVNEYVSSEVCTACDAGKTRPLGDPASGGPDTTCAILCVEDFTGNGAGSCSACPGGSTLPAGANSHLSTSCVPTICEANRKVASSVCVVCGGQNSDVNDAGDVATGGDTDCDDLCSINRHYVTNVCEDCAFGKAIAAGDDVATKGTCSARADCTNDQYVSAAGICTNCPSGTTRSATDTPTDGVTECQATLCAVNQFSFLAASACYPCLTGSSNLKGDPLNGTDTICDDNCHANFRGDGSGTCVACAAGKSNVAGDHANINTTCEEIFCGVDEYVLSKVCTACIGDQTNTNSNGALGGNTSCFCPVNQHVQTKECVQCPAGKTNGAGDETLGLNTSCTATLCLENYYVLNNVCTHCPIGETNAAGDDASDIIDSKCDAKYSSSVSVLPSVFALAGVALYMV